MGYSLLQASSSASLISCGDPKCACGSPRCGCAAQQCTYTRSYAEQSSSSGVLLEDLLSLHDGEPSCRACCAGSMPAEPAGRACWAAG